MKLLIRLSVLATLTLGTLVLQHLCDVRDLKLPWYFLHTLVMGAVPMVWLLYENRGAPRQTWLAFITTSSLFIVLSAMAELMAIQWRFWWFYTDIDRLLGIYVGAVPLEEFFFYPLFLNLPMLFYVFLRQQDVIAPGPAPAPTTAGQKVLFNALGGLFVAGGLALLWTAVHTTQPPLDYAVQPAPDASGAIRYDTGPAQHGWTVVQAFGLALVCLLWVRVRERVDVRRLVLSAAVFVVLGFFFELIGCGRGWWVWNHQQVVGIFTWVLPVDSYSMYLTGGLLPILALEGLRPLFATAGANAPAVAGV